MREEHDKFWWQFEAARSAAADQGTRLAVWPNDARERNATPEFVYEDGWILMTEETEADAGARADLGTARAPATEDGPVKRVPLRDPENMPAVLGRLNRYRRRASLNHVVSICPDVNMCPADEPYPMPRNAEPWPPRAEDNGGEGVSIAVIDTGLVELWADDAWLTGGAGPDGQTGRADGDVRARGGRAVLTDLIREYAGHGTFITGLIRCVAPGAAVHMSNALQWAGVTTEQQLTDALFDALAREPDIISLSAGCPTQDNQPLLSLTSFVAALQEARHTLLVAAAGNEGSVEVLMPAALGPGSNGAIVSVGALRADGNGVACFSNYGPLVQVYAPGERLVNAFLTGDYRYVDPPTLRCRHHPDIAPLYCSCTCVTAPPQYAQVHFEGRARWSGTSFATPVVAGLVARHMSESRPDSPRPNSRTAARILQDTAAEFDLPPTVPALAALSGRKLIPATMSGV